MGFNACIAPIVHEESDHSVVIDGLDRVVAYVGDIFCLEEDPLSHVLNVLEFFKRLRKSGVKLSSGKARSSRTGACKFPGAHDIARESQPGRGESRTVSQPRGKAQLPTQIPQQPVGEGSTSPHAAQAGCQGRVRTSTVSTAVKCLLATLSRASVLAFPDWDAVTDGSRPFRLRSDVSIDGFETCLEQINFDGPPCGPSSAHRPSHLAHGAQLDSVSGRAGGIVWVIKRLCGYLVDWVRNIFGPQGSEEYRPRRRAQPLDAPLTAVSVRFSVHSGYRYLPPGTWISFRAFLSRLRNGAISTITTTSSETSRARAPTSSGCSSFVHADVSTTHSSSTPHMGLGGFPLPLTSGIFRPAPLPVGYAYKFGECLCPTWN